MIELLSLYFFVKRKRKAVLVLEHKLLSLEKNESIRRELKDDLRNKYSESLESLRSELSYLNKKIADAKAITEIQKNENVAYIEKIKQDKNDNSALLSNSFINYARYLFIAYKLQFAFAFSEIRKKQIAIKERSIALESVSVPGLLLYTFQPLRLFLRIEVILLLALVIIVLYYKNLLFFFRSNW